MKNYYHWLGADSLNYDTSDEVWTVNDIVPGRKFYYIGHEYMIIANYDRSLYNYVNKHFSIEPDWRTPSAFVKFLNDLLPYSKKCP